MVRKTRVSERELDIPVLNGSWLWNNGFQLWVLWIMQLLMIYLFTILASFSMAHGNDNSCNIILNWGFSLYWWLGTSSFERRACLLGSEISTWKLYSLWFFQLLAVPDFSSEYDTAVKVCDAANAKGAQVQNSPEKAILAGLGWVNQKENEHAFRYCQSCSRANSDLL